VLAHEGAFHPPLGLGFDGVLEPIPCSKRK
jgi:hypothetical protein